jgi:hypothetical protein
MGMRAPVLLAEGHEARAERTILDRLGAYGRAGVKGRHP